MTKSKQKPLYLIEHLSSGFLIALFALFVGTSWNWMNYRGPTDLGQLQNYSKMPEQFTVSLAEAVLEVTSSEQPDLDQNFDIDINIQSLDQNKIEAVDLALKFDPNKMEFIQGVYSSDNGLVYVPDNEVEAFDTNTINQEGIVSFAAFVPVDQSAFEGDKNLAKLTFKRLTEEETTIEFDENQTMVLIESKDTRAILEFIPFYITAITDDACANVECAAYDPRSDFCPDGIVVPGPEDECGCEGEPICLPIQNQDIQIKTKFKGVDKPGVDALIAVRIKETSYGAIVFDDKINFSSDPKGILTSEIISVPIGSQADIWLKGPQHRARKFEDIFLNQENMLDISQYELLPGDLPWENGLQDGVMTRDDLNALDAIIPSQNQADLIVGDINYSNEVNGDDMSLFLYTVFNQIDEEW